MARSQLGSQRVHHRGRFLVSVERRVELRDAMATGTERALAENLPDHTLAVAALPTDAGGALVYAGGTTGGEYVAAIVVRRGTPTPVPVRMAALSAEFGVEYRLDDGVRLQTLRVSVLRCKTVDPEVRTLFASFVNELLVALPIDPTETDVADELARWLGLFWRLQAPSRTDIVGLIGELTLLGATPRPAAWVRGWHSVPTSSIDFVLTEPPVEVEVKATQSATRSHTVSAGQAFSSGNRYFASVQVELRDSGTTIGDVARGIADSLEASEDRARFWAILAAECGASFGDFMAERFVADVSDRSLEFFRREDIPRPELGYPLPPGVSGLTFRSDFSTSPAQDPDAFFAEWGIDA